MTFGTGSHRQTSRKAAAGPASALPQANGSNRSLHPLDDEYLTKGLTGVARGGYEKGWAITPPGAGRDDRTGTFNAHWGAAVIAAYYLLKEIPFDAPAADTIKAQLDLLMERKTQYFEPFSKEKPDPRLIHKVPQSIESRIEQNRLHGHLVIFAAHALRALRDRPDLATPSIIKGVVNIAHEVDSVPERGRGGKTYPPYKNERDIIDTTFEHIVRYDRLRLAPYGGGRHQGVIRGNFMHWLTHTHAILKLPTMGYGNLAQRGHRALRAHGNRRQTQRGTSRLPNTLDSTTSIRWITGETPRSMAIGETTA